MGYATLADIAEAQYEPFSLGELNIEFPIGGLSVVLGPVGSGKTTLVASLLGETTLLQGKIYMPDDHANRDFCAVNPATGLSDTVAYCAQTPWLIGASIKENIVFGSKWDATRYNAVVDACALRRDFEIFELGDDTEVGEKGTTCSGGQKARIALARAIYSPAKTIILDDVLSAVDAQTARHLYVHCLQGKLVAGRTVILVTHAVNLVAPAAAFAVMLDGGRVTAQGTPHELAAAGRLDLTEVDFETPSTSSTLAASPHEVEDNIEATLDEGEGDELKAAKSVQADKAAPETLRLVAAESQSQGVIDFRYYRLYWSSMGGIAFWLLIVVVYLGTQGLQIANNAWIRDWANASDRASRLLDLAQERSVTFYLGVYVALSAVYMLGVAIRVGWNFYGSIAASRRLYDRLLRRILGAKMRFFDSTPS